MYAVQSCDYYYRPSEKTQFAHHERQLPELFIEQLADERGWFLTLEQAVSAFDNAFEEDPEIPP